MALIKRVARLFRSDLHAVLDVIEEPHVLIKQAIREMEASIVADERQLALLNRQHQQGLSRQQDLDRSLPQLEQELDICFESKKDDLARSLIKRKLETQRLARLLDRKHNNMLSDISELDTRLSENRTRLESMQQKAEVLSEQEACFHTTQGHDERWDTTDFSVCHEDIEVAFLREQQQRVSS